MAPRLSSCHIAGPKVWGETRRHPAVKSRVPSHLSAAQHVAPAANRAAMYRVLRLRPVAASVHTPIRFGPPLLLTPRGALGRAPAREGVEVPAEGLSAPGAPRRVEERAPPVNGVHFRSCNP